MHHLAGCQLKGFTWMVPDDERKWVTPEGWLKTQIKFLTFVDHKAFRISKEIGELALANGVYQPKPKKQLWSDEKPERLNEAI